MPPLTPIPYNPSHTHTRLPFKHFFLSISYFVRPHPTPPDPAPSTIQQPPTHPPHPPHPFFFRSSITHANRDRLTSPHTCHTVNPTRYSRHLEAMQTSCMTCCTSRAPSHTNPIQSITHTHTRLPFKHFFLSISYFVRPHPTPPDPAPSTIQQPPTHPPHPPHPFFFRSSITHDGDPEVFRDQRIVPNAEQALCRTCKPALFFLF